MNYNALGLALTDQDNKALDLAYKIERTLPPRMDKRTGYYRIRDMYKNHVVECAILDVLNRESKYKVRFSSLDHYYFHTGSGDAYPDFINEKGITYELKRYKLDYNDGKWWNADIRLVYLNSILYVLKEDNTLEEISPVRLFE